MDILETLDEVSLEVMVPKTVSTDGLMEVVLKVGGIERFVTDKSVVVKSPSNMQNLQVKVGRATYFDDDVCKEGCTVIVAIDAATGRRLSRHDGKVERSLTAEKPKLATFATFRMLAKVFKQGCGAFESVGALCAAMADKPKEIEKMCKDLGEVGLDESIGCGDGESFLMTEILKAADPKKAYEDVVARCGAKTPSRQLKGGRQLLVNYGWCSGDFGFIASRMGIGNGKDTANYCDASQSKGNMGRGEWLSQCCVVHDKCLQTGQETRATCTTNYRKDHCTCDSDLSSCAWNGSCHYRCGWRNYGHCWDAGCSTMSTGIAALMAIGPNC
jgi:hypothetical protein